MFTPAEYLSFAATAEEALKTDLDPWNREHHVWIAAEWRKLERFARLTEAHRPGGPDLN
jgi:hypothetical protein